MKYDVIKNRYGRLYEQPRQLAENNFIVEASCISYRRDDDVSEIHATNSGQLRWLSWSVGGFFWRLPLCVYFLFKNITKFKPNAIISGSDQIHIIIGFFASKFCDCKFMVDLYDNFESYGVGKIPALNWLYRMALEKATLITCISPTLEGKLRQEVGGDVRLECLLSTVDRTIFMPMEKLKARESLGLSMDSIIVGTAGSLREKMGIKTFFEAIEIMSITFPKLIFVLAGEREDSCPLPKTENVMYLGKLEHNAIPQLINSLDVAVIYQSDNDYGKYAFPQKAFEFAACKVPIVAADVGCMPEVFKDISRYMYEWNDPISLVEAIRKQIVDKRVSEVKIDDWGEHGKRLAVLVTELGDGV